MFMWALTPPISETEMSNNDDPYKIMFTTNKT